jgi:hypothetical protein
VKKNFFETLIQNSDIITLHIAYSTAEAIHDILETTINNIQAFYKGEKLNRIV